MIRLWNTFELLVIGILGLAALLISSYQMVTRYFWPDMAVGWAEEVVIYLIVWATFIGGSTLAYRGTHVRADIVIRLLPPRWHRAVEIAVHLMCLILACLFTWYGYLIVMDSYDIGERSVTGLGFPMWKYYMAFPVGMALMALRFAGRLYVLLKGDMPQGSDPNTPPAETA